MRGSVLSSLIKFIFPDKCIFCSSILEDSSGINICDKCNEKVIYVGNKEIIINRLLYKDLKDRRYFKKVICVFEYEGLVRKAIIKYKYNGKSAYYLTFAKLIAAKLHTGSGTAAYDAILSVPLFGRRKRNRGYNQSELISRSIGKMLGIPDISYSVKRIKNTSAQSTLGKMNRYENVKGAFKVVHPEMIKNKKILVIDDVLTTGNTINECCRVLDECGALSIDAAFVAVSFRLKLQ